MKAFLRRWLEIPSRAAPPPTPESPLDTPVVRISRLEERVDYLEGALNKLRGIVTGGLAHRPKPQEDPQPAQDAPGPTIDAPPIAQPQPDRWMALAGHRRAKNGVLPR